MQYQGPIVKTYTFEDVIKVRDGFKVKNYRSWCMVKETALDDLLTKMAGVHYFNWVQ